MVSNSLLLSSLVAEPNHTDGSSQIEPLQSTNVFIHEAGWTISVVWGSTYILCSTRLQAMSIWERSGYGGTRILFLSYHPYSPFSYSFTQSESPDSYQVPVPLNSLMLELLTCFSYINYTVALRYWPTQLLLMHSFLLVFFFSPHCHILSCHRPYSSIFRHTNMSNGPVSHSLQLFSVPRP